MRAVIKSWIGYRNVPCGSSGNRQQEYIMIRARATRIRIAYDGNF